MQEVSALYNSIRALEHFWYETRIVIGDGGDLVTERGERIVFGNDTIVVARTGPDSGFVEDVIFSVKTTTEMFKNTPEIGNAVSQEIDVQMIKPSGDIPRMAVIIPYVRAVGSIQLGTSASASLDTVSLSGYVSVDNETVVFSDGSNAVVQGVTLKLTNKSGTVESEWLQQGKFYIDTREYSRNDDGIEMLTLHGYDAMMMAETDYATTSLEWPAVDVDIVNEIAQKIKTQVDPRTLELMTAAYEIPAPTSYTMREILGIIAAKYLGCFVITETGMLRLVSFLGLPKETNLLIDSDGYCIVFGEDRILV